MTIQPQPISTLRQGVRNSVMLLSLASAAFLTGWYLFLFKFIYRTPISIGIDYILIRRLQRLSRLPCYRQAQRIALYGAGLHTRRLLKTAVIPLSRIVAIFDDNPHQSELNGIPIHACTDAGKIGFDILLVSSDVHEPTLMKKAVTWLPKGKTLAALYANKTLTI